MDELFDVSHTKLVDKIIERPDEIGENKKRVSAIIKYSNFVLKEKTTKSDKLNKIKVLIVQIKKLIKFFKQLEKRGKSKISSKKPRIHRQKRQPLSRRRKRVNFKSTSESAPKKKETVDIDKMESALVSGIPYPIGTKTQALPIKAIENRKTDQIIEAKKGIELIPRDITPILSLQERQSDLRQIIQNNDTLSRNTTQNTERLDDMTKKNDKLVEQFQNTIFTMRNDIENGSWKTRQTTDSFSRVAKGLDNFLNSFNAQQDKINKDNLNTASGSVDPDLESDQIFDDVESDFREKTEDLKDLLEKHAAVEKETKLDVSEKDIRDKIARLDDLIYSRENTKTTNKASIKRYKNAIAVWKVEKAKLEKKLTGGCEKKLTGNGYLRYVKKQNKHNNIMPRQKKDSNNLNPNTHMRGLDVYESSNSNIHLNQLQGEMQMRDREMDINGSINHPSLQIKSRINRLGGNGMLNRPAGRSNEELSRLMALFYTVGIDGVSRIIDGVPQHDDYVVSLEVYPNKNVKIFNSKGTYMSGGRSKKVKEDISGRLIHDIQESYKSLAHDYKMNPKNKVHSLGGVFSDMYNRYKGGVDEREGDNEGFVEDDVKDYELARPKLEETKQFRFKVFKEDLPENMPPGLRNLTAEWGDAVITKAKICRVPLASAIQKVGNIVTLGKLDKMKKTLGYEDLFHLYVEVTLERPNGKIGHFAIEKNQKASYKASSADITRKGGTCIEQNPKKRVTLLEAFKRAEKAIGPKALWVYDLSGCNCQDFAVAFLGSGNSMLTAAGKKFALQDAAALVPKLLGVVKGVTGFANRLKTFLSGKGYYDGGSLFGVHSKKKTGLFGIPKIRNVGGSEYKKRGGVLPAVVATALTAVPTVTKGIGKLSSAFNDPKKGFFASFGKQPGQKKKKWTIGDSFKRLQNTLQGKGYEENIRGRRTLKY